jgi:hypothetical protein
VTSLKGKLVQLGIRAAQLGTNVVFDFGFWGKTNDQHSAGSLAPSGRVAKSSTCRLTTKSNAGVSPPIRCFESPCAHRQVGVSLVAACADTSRFTVRLVLITIDGMGSDDELIANAQATFGAGLRPEVEPAGGGFTAHLVGDDGTIAWPDFAAGPDRLLALLAAEQRYLVEERGSGSVSGRTYEDKARERLRRWRMERSSASG